MKKKIGAVLLVIIMALALGLPVLPASAASIIYVDWEADGANDGTSWDHAYTDLQSALASAKAGNEIWVAEGTYKPISGSDRSVSFELDGGQKVYGGFDGTETSREQRDWVANQTILSGDIGSLAYEYDNSYHVVMVQSADNIIVDGFTITGGNADNKLTPPHHSGGGIYTENSGLTVNNCIIYGNKAVWYGGGLAAHVGGSVTLNNNIFTNNKTTESVTNRGGGGISLGNAQLALINSIVNGNTSAAQGGGIRAGGACELIITNSTIVNNTADTEGGGIRLGRTNIITNSIVWGNSGDQVYEPEQGVETNTITYSLVQVEGEDPYPGEGNINGDPELDGNLRLSDNSPAIDVGNNRAVSSNIDLDGNPRIVDGDGDGVATVDMGAFEYLTPIQADTLDLIEQVGELVDSEVLNRGQGNALIVKLEAAFDKMYRNDKTAINQLEAFINQVEDFIEKGILSEEEEGQPLIDAANEIIDDIS